MAKPTKKQVDAVKLKYMEQKYSKPAKKSGLDATTKKSDSTSGGPIKSIKGIAKKRKKRHEMLRDI